MYHEEQFDCRHIKPESVAKLCEFPGIDIVKGSECGLILAHPMPSSTDIEALLFFKGPRPRYFDSSTLGSK